MNDRGMQPILTRTHIFTIVFFAVFLFLLYQIGYLLAPFSAALLWAGIIALALHPLYRRLVVLLKGRPRVAAAAMTMTAFVVVIGPAVTLLTIFFSQSVALYEWLVEGIRSGALLDLWNRELSSLSQTIRMLPFLEDVDVQAMLINGLKQLSANLASQIGAILRHTLLFIVHLFIMVIALYYFFLNGDRYYQAAMDIIPFTGEQKRAISRKLYDTFTAVINGVFLIALGQGIMTGLGFAVFRVPFAVFWGFLAAILALLPVGGTALVWIPGALYLMLTASTLKGVLLAIWGTILVSLPDNFVKPMVIGKKANLPTFFLFLGILGGLQAYGILGILFGPLIVTLVITFTQIYREEFAGKE